MKLVFHPSSGVFPIFCVCCGTIGGTPELHVYTTRLKLWQEERIQRGDEESFIQSRENCTAVGYAIDPVYTWNEDLS